MNAGIISVTNLELWHTIVSYYHVKNEHDFNRITTLMHRNTQTLVYQNNQEEGSVI